MTLIPRHRPAVRRTINASRLGTTLAVAGGAIALAALANGLVARRSERHHPPKGKFVTVDGVRVHYLEKGSGTPVVFLHGNGAMAEVYEASGVLDRIAEDHRVIAFDRPGFGYSERPRQKIWSAAAQAALLQHALEELGIERAVVVGHSWGTLVALSMALDFPSRVAALVLLSGYYFPTPRADVALSSWAAVPVLGDLLRYTVSPLLGWLLASPVMKKLFAPATVPETFKTKFPLALALRPSQIRATAADTALMIPGAAASADRHAELTMPIFILGGAGDEIVSTDGQSGKLHADIAHSDFRTIPGAGHMIHHIVPDQVVDAIRAGLAAVDATEPRIAKVR